MKVDLMDWNGKRTYAMYDNFRVADEKVSFHILLMTQNTFFCIYSPVAMA